MYAIVRQGNGKYYLSAVFGYYKHITATEEFARYHQQYYSQYYIVFNEEKTALIRQYTFDRVNKYLIPSILIVDTSQDDWVVDECGLGGVDFLPEAEFLKMLESNRIPSEILEKCRRIDSAFTYSPYQSIHTEKDIENLMAVSGYFHDARITKLEKGADSLYVLFDGTWGCSIEVWFEGDVTYDTSSRDPKVFDPYWLDSSVILHNGFIYLVDEGGMTVDKINEEYCWFRARHMTYRVIPD